MLRAEQDNKWIGYSDIEKTTKAGVLDCCNEKPIFLISFESGSIWNVCALCSQLEVFSRHIRSKEVLK